LNNIYNYIKFLILYIIYTTMSISYEEYNELIGKHKGVKRNRMRPGCYYYIEDTSRKEYQYRDVYHGKFLRINN